MYPLQSHEDNRLLSHYHLLSHHLLYRPSTDREFRDSFSRLKKKVKYRLTGSKPKPNGPGADVGGERVESTGSRLGSEPHVIAGGSHDQEGDGANVGGGQIISTVRLPQPDDPGSVLTRGSANDQEGMETDVDVEVTEESELAEGREIDVEKIERVYPSLATTSSFKLQASTPHHGKPDSA